MQVQSTKAKVYVGDIITILKMELTHMRIDIPQRRVNSKRKNKCCPKHHNPPR